MFIEHDRDRKPNFFPQGAFLLALLLPFLSCFYGLGFNITLIIVFIIITVCHDNQYHLHSHHYHEQVVWHTRLAVKGESHFLRQAQATSQNHHVYDDDHHDYDDDLSS